MDPNDYLVNVRDRLQDQIEDNSSYLEDIKELVELELTEKMDKDKIKEFMFHVTVEELRRINKDEDSDFYDDILELCDIDKKKHIDEYIDNINMTYFLGESNIEIYLENKITIFSKLKSEHNFDFDLKNINLEMRKLYMINKHYIKNRILPMLYDASYICDSPYFINCLSDIGIEFNLTAIIIHNYYYNIEKDYIADIKNNDYINLYFDPVKSINQLIGKTITHVRYHLIDELTDHAYYPDEDEIINIFINTDNLNIAAGILKGLKKTDVLYHKLLDVIVNNKVNLAMYKIKMIISARYNKLILIANEQGYPIPWMPTKDERTTMVMSNPDIQMDEWYFILK
jgi:hypothetical protein